MKTLEVKKLSKNFDDVIAIDNISFELSSGEIIGFIGKNGAGKSTTINIIMNILFPTKGVVNISNKLVVSYVPDEPSFYDNLTGYDVLRIQYLINPYEESKLEELAKYLEFDLTKKSGELSLGNKKKLAIICALLKNADVIIMDEPTSGLDPIIQEKLFILLQKEKNIGKTILLSSHNLNEIKLYTDKVIVIKDAKIVKIANMNEINSLSNYKISYINSGNKKIEVVWKKDINKFIEKISSEKIRDLEIKKEDIIDEFLTYYREEK